MNGRGKFKRYSLCTKLFLQIVSYIFSRLTNAIVINLCCTRFSLCVLFARVVIPHLSFFKSRIVPILLSFCVRCRFSWLRRILCSIFPLVSMREIGRSFSARSVGFWDFSMRITIACFRASGKLCNFTDE